MKKFNKKKFAKVIGRDVREYRTLILKKRQGEVAKKLKWSQTKLCAVENGRKVITMEDFITLSHFMGIKSGEYLRSCIIGSNLPNRFL